MANDISLEELAKLAQLNDRANKASRVLGLVAQQEAQEKAREKEERESEERQRLFAEALDLAAACSMLYEHLALETLVSARTPFERLMGRPEESQKLLGARFTVPNSYLDYWDGLDYATGWRHFIIDSIVISPDGSLRMIEEADRSKEIWGEGYYDAYKGRGIPGAFEYARIESAAHGVVRLKGEWRRTELVPFTPGNARFNLADCEKALASALASPGRRRSLIRRRDLGPDMLSAESWGLIVSGLTAVLKQTRDRLEKSVVSADNKAVGNADVEPTPRDTRRAYPSR